MSDVDFLKWDSSFFDRKIGRVDLKNKAPENDLITKLSNATQNKYELLYVFSDAEKNISKTILNKFKGKLVDVKITFNKDVNQNDSILSPNISSYTSLSLDKDLIKLAFLSGIYSRFKTSLNFTLKDFEKLYLEWLRKSVSRDIADDFFVYKENNKIVGMVTVAIKENVGHIGLIAVDPDFQGKKIGSHLINHVEYYLAKQNIKQLHVPTQKNNELACQFYKKNEFTIHSSLNIYHFALNLIK